eukprot:CAMPEP_0171621200 /NCGR_PEP_ID=MMETSP0990-20121206/16465_1 /TAXON_ID=483369 /ORGANISM="non described non described, Strain CCMP2098" /LENGTH=76 /DNA_ID=CAMNT_0012186679 /DNA_START=218 /DNA_END=448 /DNA_ORIENTATION=-
MGDMEIFEAIEAGELHWERAFQLVIPQVDALEKSQRPNPALQQAVQAVVAQVKHTEIDKPAHFCWHRACQLVVRQV